MLTSPTKCTVQTYPSEEVTLSVWLFRILKCYLLIIVYLFSFMPDKFFGEM